MNKFKRLFGAASLNGVVLIKASKVTKMGGVGADVA